MNKTFQTGKWRIEIDQKIYGATGKIIYTVHVYNMNAKTAFNQMFPKYHEAFYTEENRNEWVRKFVERQQEWEETKKERRQARKSEETLTSIVKKGLVSKYGYKNVSVKNGTGTAWGWVKASIVLNKPEPKCENCLNSVYGRCFECREKYQKDLQEAEHIAYEAVKEAGKHFYTYCSDDGYGTERSEFNLSIDYK